MSDFRCLRLLIVKLCLGIVLFWAIALGIPLFRAQPVAAQSGGAIAAEISSLRTQVNRLDNEVRRLNQAVFRLSQTTRLPSRNAPAPRVEPLPREPTDPMFDRLATLVIELKERVIALETKMEKLEQKFLSYRDGLI